MKPKRRQSQFLLRLADVHIESFQAADGTVGVELGLPGATKARMTPYVAGALAACLFKHALLATVADFGSFGLTPQDLDWCSDLLGRSLSPPKKPLDPEQNVT